MLTEEQSKAAASKMEYKKRSNILGTGVMGILWKNNFDIDKRWQLIVDDTKTLVGYKSRIEQNNSSFKKIEQSFTAFTKTQELEGRVNLEFEGKQLFYARDGELIRDDLDITSQDILGKSKKLIEGKGLELIGRIKRLLDTKFESEELEELTFETNKYVVTKKAHNFFILNKSSQKIVASDLGFTNDATIGDMLYTHQIPESIQQEFRQLAVNEKLTNHISQMLDLIGESDKKGLVTYLSSHNFYFSKFQDFVQVSRLGDSIALIYDNDGFTTSATDKDIEKVKSVERFLNSYQAKAQTNSKAKESQIEID